MTEDIEVGRYALRTFRVAHGQLRSLFKDHTWENGTAVAACLPQLLDYGNSRAPHQSPGEHCHCGLYGTLTLAQLAEQYSRHAATNVAVIAAEGTTYIGELGLRTAAARVVGYWTCDRLCGDDGPRYIIDRAHELALRRPRSWAEIYADQVPQAHHFPQMAEMLSHYGFEPMDWPPESEYARWVRLADEVRLQRWPTPDPIPCWLPND